MTEQAKSSAERLKHQQRATELRKRLAVPLDPQTAARLKRNYGGRVDAIGPKPPTDDGLPDTPPLGPSKDGLPPSVVEDQAIAENAQTPQAQAPHPFMEAEFPDENGDPRCRLCGQGSAAHKVFEPEIPIAAAQEPDVRATLTVTERNAPALAEGQASPPVESQKAFVTELNGRTLITAPANVFTTEAEKALHVNEHFLWMQGRFVGAEKANRNGAFWSTEDLELGELTVRHGPLNWLHEARHVTGAIADIRMVKRDEQSAMLISTLINVVVVPCPVPSVGGLSPSLDLQHSRHWALRRWLYRK